MEAATDMDSCWDEKDDLVDKKTVDSLAAELAAAITGAYMLKKKFAQFCPAEAKTAFSDSKVSKDKTLVLSKFLRFSSF